MQKPNPLGLGLSLVVVDVSKSGFCGVAYTGRRILVPASGDCFNWVTAAHELGHTFLLQHDFRDGRYIMSYGSGTQRISECAAGWLDVNPYFNPNRFESNKNGNIEILSSIAYPSDDLQIFFEITDPDKLHQIRFLHGHLTMYSCQLLSGEREIVKFIASAHKLKDNRANVQVADSYGNIIWGGWFKFDGIEPDVILDISMDGSSVDDGLIGYWMFDEANGQYAFDASGNGNYAELLDGATLQLAKGKIGGALRLSDGKESASVFNGGDLINGLGAFTLSLWVKSDEVNTDRGVIFPRTPNGKDEIFALRYDAKGLSGGGTNVIKAGITTTDGVQVYESASHVQTTQWQHLTLTWRSGRELKLYINGVLDRPTFNSAATEGEVTGARTLLIGRGSNDNSRTWKGFIDDVRIYDRVLSPGEIANLVIDIEARVSARLLSDINTDGKVNILDLVKVASQFGESGKGLRGDVNKDGTVNILDLVQVASDFSEV